jgi:Tol biopolymer transport system component
VANRWSLVLGRVLLVSCLCLLAAPGGADQNTSGADRLAFVSDGDSGQALYVIDVTRATTTRLTTGQGQIDSPGWAPDGSRLVFASTSGAASSIFVVNADGTGLQRLASGRNPAWSPDGTRIAFAATQGGNEDIVLLSLDTSTRQRVTTHPSRDFSPQWAPDGTRIAFASSRGESSRLAGREYGSEIYVMNADGSGVHALTGHNACGLAHDGEGKLNSLGEAAWTPDGRRLLYRAGSCKFDCKACVIDVTEGRVSPLTTERPATAFSLSPDGRSVAYSSSHGIFVTALGGGAARALVADAWGPAWSRDGKRIAFLVSAGPDVHARQFHIEGIDPTGGNRQRLTARAGHYGSLTWSPTGVR